MKHTPAAPQPGLFTFLVIANQSADWCGNLLNIRGIATVTSFPRNDSENQGIFNQSVKYPLTKTEGYAIL